MIKTKTKKRLERALSCVLAFVMTASMSTVLPAAAEEVERYPYVILAADKNTGITVDADGFTLNGNAHSNGEFSVASSYSNINGKITDIDDVEETEEVFDVSSDMIFMHNKLTTRYFTDNCLTFDESYTYTDNNVNVHNPIYVTGELNLEGNVTLNNAIGAVSDIELSDGNLNGNNTVIYSKFGDIDISGGQASVNGLIYAPFGTVTIDSDNFNLNGVIIAQSVVISCEGNVNINYNYGVGEMIGVESEEVSWTFEEWEYLVDTDDDGIPDLVEKEIDIDPYIPDTDGDKLTDGYEVLYLGTDPTVVDSDENGVSDADEDFDEDGLTNIQEYDKETDPYNEDTDGDELKDGEEVNTYFTNPIVADTDEDGLDDGDEIHFNANPLNPDTDGDGIPDGNEKRFQTFIHEAENKDSAVTEVRVSMNATGNLEKTTTVESIMGNDILCSEVVGLVGEPFSIETTSEFDKATITYVIDKSKLGDTEFDNLLFLWYDEENDEFVELDTILDEENSTVSVETTHFSCYMLVDQVEWFEAWKMASLYFEEHYEPLASVICYDCSGSMISNDPDFMHNVFDDTGRIVYSYPTCYRKLAIDNFIDSMKLTDLTALVSFETSATLVSGFSDDKNALKNLVKPYNKGLTNAQAAIDIALDELSTAKHWYSRHIILLSDGDVNVTDAQLLQAKKAEIKIHTIGLGAGANNKELQKYADETGGQFFVAATADELDEIYQDLALKNHFDLKGLPDEDEDGLPDEFEVSGMILPNGQIFYTDSEIKDCDGDNLADGEEIFIDYSETQFVIKKDKRGGNIEYSTVVFGYRSDPNDIDTDGDGIFDNVDSNSTNYNVVIDSDTTSAVVKFIQDYLGMVMPPVYNNQGKKITSKNKICPETEEYFLEYIWPYLKDLEWAKYDYLPQYEYLANQQRYSCYTNWLRNTYGTWGIETFWVKNSNMIAALYDELANIGETFENAKEQIILGNYADDITITGTAGQIVVGFSGIDFVADMRDVTYDATHWEWSWSHVGQTALDSVGLIPVIGVIKNIDKMKNADEFIDVVKNLDKFSGSVVLKDKEKEYIRSLIKNADKATKLKIKESPEVWAKLATQVGENDDLVVLGKFDVSPNYLEVAEKLKATHYNNEWWYELKVVYGSDEAMWEINEIFLETQTAAKKTIIFSQSPHEIKYLLGKDGQMTSFAKEIEYLKNTAKYDISTIKNKDGFYYAVPK